MANIDSPNWKGLRAISPFSHSVFKRLVLQTCKNKERDNDIFILGQEQGNVGWYQNAGNVQSDHGSPHYNNYGEILYQYKEFCFRGYLGFFWWQVKFISSSGHHR